MSKYFTISSKPLTIKKLKSLLQGNRKVKLSTPSIKKIKNCYTYLQHKLKTSDDLFYGINTGFGSLCNIRISKKETTELQANLIRSHSCGMGDEVPLEVSRLILFLKIKNLSLGYSAVSLELVERLIAFYNNDIIPQIFQLGSLGASGDLAPLAHLALPLIGEGKVYHKGKLIGGERLEKLFGWRPLRLKAKEGLAMLNGTQFSTAYGVWCCIKLEELLAQANATAALSMDVFKCHLKPFDKKLHLIRAHKGQLATAKSILKWRKGSSLAKGESPSVQDPYAFRCVPQVHGASYDALAHTMSVLTTEINSVTDNPTVFPKEDEILSGGNFHAQPIALVLDYVALACAELGNISERRLYQLISGERGLPAFLTLGAGLQSGMMISQYTAASIVSQNKQLATPASVDSIVSCNGQEDHVSMAANAATRLYKMVLNTERILAIEWMNAAQALDLRRPQKTSKLLEAKHSAYRQVVTSLTQDRNLSLDMHQTLRFLRNYKPQK